MNTYRVQAQAPSPGVPCLRAPPKKQRLLNGRSARTELIWFPEWVLGHGKISTKDRDWNCTAHHSQKDEWKLPYICPYKLKTPSRLWRQDALTMFENRLLALLYVASIAARTLSRTKASLLQRYSSRPFTRLLISVFPNKKRPH